MKNFLCLLIIVVSVLMPAEAWATVFIKDIAVANHTKSGNGEDWYKKDTEACKQLLRNAGYTNIVDVDLNKGAGGHYIYLGYTTTTNPSEAITNIVIVDGDMRYNTTLSIEGLTYQRAAWYGSDFLNGNLNRGAGGWDIYLFYTKDRNTWSNVKPVTAIDIVALDSEANYSNGVQMYRYSRTEWDGIADLNKSAGGDYIYMLQDKNHVHTHNYYYGYDDVHHGSYCVCGLWLAEYEHVWENTGPLKTAATCTTVAVYYQKCKTCGRTGDANHTYIVEHVFGHSFDDEEDPHHTLCTRCHHTFFRYQSFSNRVHQPFKDNFGEAQILSNTYTNGEGVIEFDRPLTCIGESAFSRCLGFTGNLVLPNSVTNIGKSAFSGCLGFTGNLVIPNSVTSIEDYAFNGCSGFTGDLVIPNSVTSIGEKAFQDCSGFNGNLSIGNSVTSIGEYAFFECSGFTGDLVLPNSVTNIEKGAFYKCSGFTGNLVIPNSVTSIGESAFYYCSGFTGDFVLPNSVTSIGSSAFSGCSGFTGKLVISNSVTSIGNYAFAYCSGFTGDLVIPNSVTNIGKYAFRNCSGFNGNLSIGNSVASIGENTFYNCSNLTSVEFGSVPYMGSSVFSSVRCSKNIALTDSSYIYLDNNPNFPQMQSASYTRQMSNTWGTLVLPFNINYDPENGNYKLYKLVGVESDQLCFSEYAAGNITAGTPLAVKLLETPGVLTIEQSTSTIDNKANSLDCGSTGWIMKGTYEPKTAAAEAQFDPEGKNIYYIAQNQFWHANQKFDMARFRAWFEAPATLNAAAMRFSIVETDATGIQSVDNSEADANCYDLQGRRLSAPAKGLQIMNGKRVILK